MILCELTISILQLSGVDITDNLLKSLNTRKLPGLAKNDLLEVNIVKEKVFAV